MRTLLHVLALLAACFTPSRPAWAQDRSAQDLARARISYERRMDGIRDEVLKAIGGALDAASRPGKVDKDRIAQAGADRDAFLASGAWPTVTPATEPRTRASAAATSLVDAYAAAIAAYTKAGRNELRDALRAELDLFENTSDLVPWRADLLKDRAEADRLVSAAHAVTIATELPGEHRLELLLKRMTEEGRVHAVLTSLKGESADVEVLLDEKGEGRLLATIRESTLTTELGADRPPRMNGTGAAGSISLRAEGGDFRVVSMRIKPLVAGQPEKPAEPARKPPKERKEAVNEAAPVLQVGSKWSGMFKNREGLTGANATVRSADGSRLVLRVATDRYGTRDWCFTVNGPNLVLTECIPVKTRANATIKSIQVSGTVKNGSISISGTWVAQAGRGAGETISLDLTRE